jgi:coproporphyrinogen III oxidase-like Fe-S oxidoreductase
MTSTETAAGLYVHVPFCLTRCGYCDFNAHAGLDHLQDAYVQALKAEADRAAGEWSGIPFVSVFLGGGTPTTLDPEVILSLLDHLRALFDVAENAEVTCEANPDMSTNRRSARSEPPGSPGFRSASSPSIPPSWLRWRGSTGPSRPSGR